MTLHTSRHLLSAIVEQRLQLPTLSWSLTAKNACNRLVTENLRLLPASRSKNASPIGHWRDGLPLIPSFFLLDLAGRYLGNPFLKHSSVICPLLNHRPPIGPSC